jgi:hypothetical protein
MLRIHRSDRPGRLEYRRQRNEESKGVYRLRGLHGSIGNEIRGRSSHSGGSVWLHLQVDCVGDRRFIKATRKSRSVDLRFVKSVLSFVQLISIPLY